MTVLQHIKQLARNLTPEERDVLAKYFAQSNNQEPSQDKPQSLRGSWSNAFSEDFNIDAELKDSR